MDPLDPRHGTEAGTIAHRRAGQTPCDPCKEAHRRGNIMRQLYPSKVPAIGTQRRIQALQAIGYSRQRIAHELGYTDAGALAYLLLSKTLLKVTAARVADVYDRLCMTPVEGVGANRARTWARKHGYVPPLAWDDIDNPRERPKGLGQPAAIDRADILTDLDEWGAGISEALRRLDMNRDALQKWCSREGKSELYRRLVAREKFTPNGVMQQDGAA
jgi:hypothetical protein